MKGNLDESFNRILAEKARSKSRPLASGPGGRSVSSKKAGHSELAFPDAQPRVSTKTNESPQQALGYKETHQTLVDKFAIQFVTVDEPGNVMSQGPFGPVETVVYEKFFEERERADIAGALVEGLSDFVVEEVQNRECLRLIPVLVTELVLSRTIIAGILAETAAKVTNSCFESRRIAKAISDSMISAKVRSMGYTAISARDVAACSDKVVTQELHSISAGAVGSSMAAAEIVQDLLQDRVRKVSASFWLAQELYCNLVLRSAVTEVVDSAADEGAWKSAVRFRAAKSVVDKMVYQAMPALAREVAESSIETYRRRAAVSAVHKAWLDGEIRRLTTSAAASACSACRVFDGMMKSRVCAEAKVICSLSIPATTRLISASVHNAAATLAHNELQKRDVADSLLNVLTEGVVRQTAAESMSTVHAKSRSTSDCADSVGSDFLCGRMVQGLTKSVALSVLMRERAAQRVLRDLIKAAIQSATQKIVRESAMVGQVSQCVLDRLEKDLITDLAGRQHDNLLMTPRVSRAILDEHMIPTATRSVCSQELCRNCIDAVLESAAGKKIAKKRDLTAVHTAMLERCIAKMATEVCAKEIKECVETRRRQTFAAGICNDMMKDLTAKICRNCLYTVEAAQKVMNEMCKSETRTALDKTYEGHRAAVTISGMISRDWDPETVERWTWHISAETMLAGEISSDWMREVGEQQLYIEWAAEISYRAIEDYQAQELVFSDLLRDALQEMLRESRGPRLEGDIAAGVFSHWLRAATERLVRECYLASWLAERMIDVAVAKMCQTARFLMVGRKAVLEDLVSAAVCKPTREVATGCFKAERFKRSMAMAIEKALLKLCVKKITKNTLRTSAAASQVVSRQIESSLSSLCSSVYSVETITNCVLDTMLYKQLRTQANDAMLDYALDFPPRLGEAPCGEHVSPQFPRRRAAGSEGPRDRGRRVQGGGEGGGGQGDQRTGEEGG